jgi:ketosteroid isomerase-like protein
VGVVDELATPRCIQRARYTALARGYGFTRDEKILSTYRNEAGGDMAMTANEKRNVERTRHWEWTWNNDVMRMVDECYAKDCEVMDMFRQRTLRGREELRAIEQQMIAVDETRRMKITKMVASGDTVVVEVDALWRNGEVTAKGCVVLTYNADGMIVSDHSYSGDPLGAAE